MSYPVRNPFSIQNNPRPAVTMARPLGVRGHQKRSIPTPCLTMGKEIFVEGPWERLVLLALDVDPRTTYIAAQPFTVRLDIPAAFKDKSMALAADPPLAMAYAQALNLELVYTPDFEVKDGGQVPLAVEVKDERNVVAPVFDRRRAILKRLGYRFLAVTDKDVGHRGLERNLVFARDATKILRDGQPQAHLDELLAAVDGFEGPFRLGLIRGAVSDLAIQLGLVTGVVAYDLKSGALGVNTVLWLAYGDLQHLQLLNLESASGQ